MIGRPRTVGIPERWRHREPAITINGTTRLYWLHCQRCFRPKGRTTRRLCLYCRRREPRKLEIDIRCDCGRQLDRNAVIRALYIAGVSGPLLATIFRLSPKGIMNVVHR